MVVSAKDGLKLVGISVVSFCAVFVCTFFINYYIDVHAIERDVPGAYMPLYDAQVAMSRLVCGITGGVLGAIVVIMLAFYIKLYIDGNAKRFGLFKAMGYSENRLAAAFWVFGLAVLVGAGAGGAGGYAAMPAVYDNMTIGELSVPIGFHAWLPFALVLLPSVLSALVACVYARIKLRGGALDMLKGKARSTEKRTFDSGKPFLAEMRRAVLCSNKSVVFFVAFACFCFAAMVQMSLSMRTLSSELMGGMIFAIGVVLSATAMIMAVTTVITRNSRNIAVMKACGYSVKQCAVAVLCGYIPFAVLGFAIGTVYQYGLLKIMCDILFADVAIVPDYSFDVPMFFATLAAFMISYSATMLYYARKIDKVSLKQIMLAD